MSLSGAGFRPFPTVFSRMRLETPGGYFGATGFISVQVTVLQSNASDALNQKGDV